MKTIKIIFSCEHATQTIPENLSALFKEYSSLLNTHRAIDFGARELADNLYNNCGDAFYEAQYSRLVVDLNRSLYHKKLFSEVTKHLSIEKKQQLLKTIYLPYREKIEKKIKKWIINNNFVFHFSIHSFIPLLNGQKRNNDLGLLFDPKRKWEKIICHRWKEKFNTTTSFLTRLNYPYLGKADGFTSCLRKKFAEEQYVGIEIEMNQAILQSNKLDCLQKLLIKEILSLKSFIE